VSDVASSNLQGKIELAELRHVGWHDLDVGRVTIRDPQGREVIVARDTKVAFDVSSIAKGVFGAKPTIAIDAIALRPRRSRPRTRSPRSRRRTAICASCCAGSTSRC
jgi:autotransporter translocation and assembly factor TamB